jgi:hypothetical protein
MGYSVMKIAPADYSKFLIYYLLSNMNNAACFNGFRRQRAENGEIQAALSLADIYKLRFGFKAAASVWINIIPNCSKCGRNSVPKYIYAEVFWDYQERKIFRLFQSIGTTHNSKPNDAGSSSELVE